MSTTTDNDSFNDDEIEAPNWLNEKFFEEALSKHEKDPSLKVVDVKISPASAKGDHYASVMFRANVSYTTERGKMTKSLIIKTMPEMEGHKKDMIGTSHIFETEIGMYTKVLPKFEDILRKAGDHTKLYVPCIYSSLEPRQVMIFEDIVPQGFEVIRERDATKEEIKSTLFKLAKWHAASFYVLHEEPDYLQDFKHGLFDTPKIVDDPFVNSGIRQFVSLLEDDPELRKYLPFFKGIENDFLDRCGLVYQEYRKNRQSNGYYVLSHGDFHIKNMMFKHSKIDGKLEDVMLLDFQFSNVCPITVDVIYAIYMIMSSEIRLNNFKELIDDYFLEFTTTLQKIGFKGELPTAVEFWKQIAKHKYCEFLLMTTFLPMMCVIKLKTFDPAEIIQNEEVRKKLYRLDIYINDVKHLLSRLEKQGYFE